MQFIPFNEQYDETPMRLVPFNRQQHMQNRYQICLQVHPKNPQLNGLKALIETYAKRLKAALKFSYVPQMENIHSAEITVVKPGGGEISLKGCHNTQKVEELFQLIVC